MLPASRSTRDIRLAEVPRRSAASGPRTAGLERASWPRRTPHPPRRARWAAGATRSPSCSWSGPSSGPSARSSPRPTRTSPTSARSSPSTASAAGTGRSPQSCSSPRGSSPTAPAPSPSRVPPSSSATVGAAPAMLISAGIGLLWIVVFYVISGTDTRIPVYSDLGNWNIVIGMGFIVAAFGFATKWE
ncbi:MAG: cell division protein CrgA [Aeromicrobium erythreum]